MNTSDLQRKASKTALSVAMLRAVHQILDARPKILDDPIAGILLGDEFDRKIAGYHDRAREPSVMELRSQVVLRSRFAEDHLAEAVRRGAGQYVIRVRMVYQSRGKSDGTCGEHDASNCRYAHGVDCGPLLGYP